jgi:hypothetical protein
VALTTRHALLLALGCSLFPVSVSCGTAAAGYTCMPAPDPDGYVDVYYEIEPLIVAAAEFLTGTNIPVHYRAGHHRRRL